MSEISVRYGATLPLLLTNDEENGNTARLTLSQNGVVKFTKLVSFVGFEADLTMTAVETRLPVGEYDYMITVTYIDGSVEKYPDLDNCSDCELPTLEICEANDAQVS